MLRIVLEVVLVFFLAGFLRHTLSEGTFRGCGGSMWGLMLATTACGMISNTQTTYIRWSQVLYVSCLYFQCLPRASVWFRVCCVFFWAVVVVVSPVLFFETIGQLSGCASAMLQYATLGVWLAVPGSVVTYSLNAQWWLVLCASVYVLQVVESGPELYSSFPLMVRWYGGSLASLLFEIMVLRKSSATERLYCHKPLIEMSE